VGTVTAPTTNWWQQTFLGLEILYWIIIAIAIVAAILGIVLVSRRQARGKLVECGECGNLIPENATICPKCGAEFESNLVRCSRCGSTIPSNSKVCPECAAQLLGGAEEATKDPERQGYADFIERYRAEAKKELGDNYSEGAFWDWWKRQPTYLSFTQWRLQQGQGTRAGMTAPVESTAEPPRSGAPPSGGGMPPRQGGGGGGASAAPGSTPRGAPPPVARPPPPRPAAASPAAPSAAPASNATPPYVEPAPGAAATKPCSNCGREIPPEYLVCPFCSAVTR
ncbi:MAG: zinc ribbon domain-containing protein, partial [Thermoplasmata archaeon]